MTCTRPQAKAKNPLTRGCRPHMAQPRRNATSAITVGRKRTTFTRCEPTARDPQARFQAGHMIVAEIYNAQVASDYDQLAKCAEDEDMSKHLFGRRQFNTLCAAFGFSLPALAAGMGAVADHARRAVKFQDGPIVTAVGQGSAHLGTGRHPPPEEEEALRGGISLGMTLIDTSGDYGGGRSEQSISRVISGQRDRVFLVSKVENNEVLRDGIARACEASL